MEHRKSGVQHSSNVDAGHSSETKITVRKGLFPDYKVAVPAHTRVIQSFFRTHGQQESAAYKTAKAETSCEARTRSTAFHAAAVGISSIQGTGDPFGG